MEQPCNASLGPFGMCQRPADHDGDHRASPPYTYPRPVCPVCGVAHEPGPILMGVRFNVCPQIPENCFYQHREFPKRPPEVMRIHMLDLDA